MGITSRTFTVQARAGTGSELEYAALTLAPGQSVEFKSSATDSWCNNGGELFIYWNHKFHWDETNREAQIIGIGTGFDAVRHAWYVDASSEWRSTPAFSAISLWPVTNLGHPYQWHTITPDGTFWLKRSTEKSFQYRPRAERTTAAWSADRRTPDYVTGITGWPEALEYHHAMGRAILRYGVQVMSFDFEAFEDGDGWNYSTLPVAPTMATGGADKMATHYCHALQSVIFFGRNNGTVNDPCYLLRADGSLEQKAPPPRYVQNGNITMVSTDIDRYALFVDDPNKQHAYLLERQPSSSTLPRRVWRMNNVGTTWDGTWTEVGTTDVFTKPRADRKTLGSRHAVCAIPNYGVVWVLRQSATTHCDSFLWKPPA